jgi:aryl-alcohol dehydrogenase-like predicted oxidoreductase
LTARGTERETPVQYRRLGNSDLEVSRLCLGTMTWGSQNTAAEAHAQIDRALEAGVTFLDTAEMYPTTPRRAETVGRSEEILGDWIAAGGRRERLVIATKITGPNGGLVRDGRGIHADTLRIAVEGSLRRLRTEVIDLYQLHWPNRGSYHFRQNWTYDPVSQDRTRVLDEMAEALDTLAALVREGRIRHVGLSNESAWGTAAWLRLAAETGGPRMVTIQNEYSLLCRIFDTDLAELAHHEQVDLLAFSPLACGLLTGKYRDGTQPPGSRATINAGLNGRMTPRAGAAVAAYGAIAARHGLSPVALAIGFALSRPFLGAAIVGATSVAQLDESLAAADLALAPEVLAEIDAAHRQHPMPY